MFLTGLDLLGLISRSMYGETGSETEEPDEKKIDKEEEEDDSDEEETEEEEKLDSQARKQVRAARAAEKRAKRQLADMAKKFEDSEKKYKNEKLSEVEQLRQSLAEAQRQTEEATNNVKKLSIRNRILSIASKEGFADPEDVVAYMTFKGAEEDEIDDMIEELKEEKPYLLMKNQYESEDTPGKAVGQGGAGKRIRKTKLEGRADDTAKRQSLQQKYDEAKRRGDSQTMRIIWSQAEKLIPREKRIGSRRIGLFEYEEPLEEEA